MTQLELKSLIKRNPFRPFTIMTDAGVAFYVDDPDNIAINQYSGDIHLFTQKQVIYLSADAVRIMNEGGPLEGSAQ